MAEKHGSNMNKTKIVFIGAGSASFGYNMFRDLFTCQELQGSILSLVDQDAIALERMYHLAVKMNAEARTGLVIEMTTDRRQALPGAGFVVNSIAVERNRLWKLDFEIPKKYGIRHTLGENGGPGGVFFTLRTIPMILDIAHDMEELCPKALFINFSNPESRIILALGRYSKIHAVGLCHGVFMGRDDMATIMGMQPERLDVRAAGLNHFQWFLGVYDKDTGEDLYPRLHQNEQTFDPTFRPLSRRLFRAFGHYPSCSDDHLGEYLAYGWEGGEEGYNFEWDEQYRHSLLDLIGAITRGEQTYQDWRTPSGERGVAVITGILHNQHRWIESGVVYNQGVIANLSPDSAVEVPLVVDAQGVHPVSTGYLPDGIAKLLAMQVSVQQLAVEAAVHGSKELALQALLIDPVINSAEAAEKILDELWEINRPYIRACI
jgi:alpha-galactosidase